MFYNVAVAIKPDISEDEIVTLVAQNDSKALEILSQKWWRKLGRLFSIHLEIVGDRIEGEDLYPTFVEAVWNVCKKWQKNHLEGKRKSAFYLLQDGWSKEYQKYNAQQSHSEKLLKLSVLDDNTVLTLAASRSVDISSQTLRNWIHAGKVQAKKGKYYSTTRRCKIFVWKISYTPLLRAGLLKLKNEMLERKRHHLS